MATETITLSDNGAGGSFSPNPVVFDGTETSLNFIYTPAITGFITISATSNPAITNPPEFTFLAASGLVYGSVAGGLSYRTGQSSLIPVPSTGSNDVLLYRL